jgi:hypothetical protein
MYCIYVIALSENTVCVTVFEREAAYMNSFIQWRNNEHLLISSQILILN